MADESSRPSNASDSNSASASASTTRQQLPLTDTQVCPEVERIPIYHPHPFTLSLHKHPFQTLTYFTNYTACRWIWL